MLLGQADARPFPFSARPKSDTSTVVDSKNTIQLRAKVLVESALAGLWGDLGTPLSFIRDREKQGKRTMAMFATDGTVEL